MAVGADTNKEDGLIGRIIAGKLRILELLGTGSMGRVYRAHHISLEKDVAIKVLRSSVASDPTRSSRFAREARAASRLNHPNSVAILDFGEDGEDRLLYIAMELLDGENLQEVIERGSIQIERICHIMIQSLAALAAAHDAGIIHRDVKPSNIVLVQQRNDEGMLIEVVKVCDFGVAKLYNSTSDTLDGTKSQQKVIGTPLYMSPEQALGEKIDPRTDVYSCGVILYEMLTGQPPFTAETPMRVLMKHVSDPVVPPSELVPHIDKKLEAIVLWSLEKDQLLRPSTARELRNALRAFLAGKAGTVPALARYGVEQSIGEDPWVGTTPYYQLDLPTHPPFDSQITPPPALPYLPAPTPGNNPIATHSASPSLPAPIHSVGIHPNRRVGIHPNRRVGIHPNRRVGIHPNSASLPAGAEAYDLPTIPHRGLIEDLSLISPGSSVSTTPEPNRKTQPHRATTTGPIVISPFGENVPATIRKPAKRATISSVPHSNPLLPPRSTDPALSSNHPGSGAEDTLDEVLLPLETPPPRIIQANYEPGQDSVPPPSRVTPNMIRYLWERYDIAPNRHIPSNGFWVRHNHEEMGPFTWPEITSILRKEAAEEPLTESSISADRQHWIAASRFVRLAGIEAVAVDRRPLPTKSVCQGHLQDRSVASLFGTISHRQATGRMILSRDFARRHAWFEIHVNNGRPTFVLTNEAHLQLPNLLIDKGIVGEERFPKYIQSILKSAITLEQAIRRDLQLDVTEYQSAVMRERLRHLLCWRQGHFVFDDRSRPASHYPFAPSLLALLPDLVYRTISEEDLEREFSTIRHLSRNQTHETTKHLQDMGLTPNQREIAEILLKAKRLDDIIPADRQIRKAFTTMAYILRETGLLQT